MNLTPTETAAMIDAAAKEEHARIRKENGIDERQRPNQANRNRHLVLMLRQFLSDEGYDTGRFSDEGLLDCVRSHFRLRTEASQEMQNRS